ncbi:MAG: polyphosphate kinase 2 [Candidatus Dormibacteraeota bacterium]|nr:polyphosphate kinase 2 [Candidatus Dormibacteraeota bacterium]
MAPKARNKTGTRVRGDGATPAAEEAPSAPRHLTRKEYEKELRRLQVELVQWEEWIHRQGLRVAVVFEGRDTAGKGGMIKRITELLNPRVCTSVALPKPTERESTQWYFQRYVAHLPAAGEIRLFDRSWYNRAGVERVMGYCTQEEYDDFMRSCPEFERMLIRSGIHLLKYWLSVSDDEQERRFQKRLTSPAKRWKLSPTDLQARARWVDYSEAKDDMFAYTDTREAPWHVVETDSKKTAHLNLITHLLRQFPYEPVSVADITLPPRQQRKYQRPPKSTQQMVPTWYVVE